MFFKLVGRDIGDPNGGLLLVGADANITSDRRARNFRDGPGLNVLVCALRRLKCECGDKVSKRVFDRRLRVPPGPGSLGME
nr:hypothetical protein [uncultured Dongia sp.]